MDHMDTDTDTDTGTDRPEQDTAMTGSDELPFPRFYQGRTVTYPVSFIQTNATDQESDGGSNELSSDQIEDPPIYKFQKQLSDKEVYENNKHSISNEVRPAEGWHKVKEGADVCGMTFQSQDMILDIMGEACFNPTEYTGKTADGTRTIGKVTLSDGQTFEATEIRFPWYWALDDENRKQYIQQGENIQETYQQHRFCHSCFKDLGYCKEHFLEEDSRAKFKICPITLIQQLSGRDTTVVVIDRAIVENYPKTGYQSTWRLQFIGDREVQEPVQDWVENQPVDTVSFDTLDSFEPTKALLDKATDGMTILILDLDPPFYDQPGVAVVKQVVALDSVVEDDSQEVMEGLNVSLDESQELMEGLNEMSDDTGSVGVTVA